MAARIKNFHDIIIVVLSMITTFTTVILTVQLALADTEEIATKVTP